MKGGIIVYEYRASRLELLPPREFLSLSAKGCLLCLCVTVSELYLVIIIRQSLSTFRCPGSVAAVGAENLGMVSLHQVDGLRVVDLDVDLVPLLVHAPQRLAVVEVERVRALVVGVAGTKTTEMLYLFNF